MKNSLLSRHLSILGIACSVVILSSQGTSASIIPIANFGFEDPVVGNGSYTLGVGIKGWNDAAQAGVWDPTSAYFSSVPEGTQVGYINAGLPAVSTIKQTMVGYSPQPNTTYTLTIQLGGIKDHPQYDPGISYGVDLLVGTTVVASVKPELLGPDTWTTLTATYTAPGINLPSGDLGISIHYDTTSGSGQLDFDNVRLTAVPEPSTYLAGLSALGILGWFSRRNRR